MRILIWNMNYWQNTKGDLDKVITWKKNCIDYLKNEKNIDFYILQEINPFRLFEISPNQYFTSMTGYNILYNELKRELSFDGRKDKFWGNAIIFNNNFTVEKNNMGTDHKDYYGKNAIMCYDIKTTNGKIITIINVYNKKNYEKNGAYTLLNDLNNDIDIKNVIVREGSHIILAGDFNTFAKKNNGRLKELEEKMESFTLINCTKDTTFHEEGTYYHSEKDGYGIDDFCFISKNIKNNLKIDIPIKDWDNKQDKNHRWKGLSDHAPIIVEFNF
jgi:exonuclease III